MFQCKLSPGSSTVCSWASNFTSLCLAFLIYEVGMMTIAHACKVQQTTWHTGIPSFWASQLLIPSAVSVVLLDSGGQGQRLAPSLAQDGHAINAHWLVGLVSGLCNGCTTSVDWLLDSTQPSL